MLLFLAVAEDKGVVWCKILYFIAKTIFRIERTLHDFLLPILSRHINITQGVLNEKLFPLASGMVFKWDVLLYLSQAQSVVFVCNILKPPEAYSVLLYISFLISPLDSLIFLTVTLSLVDLAHGSSAHSSLTNKTLLVLCMCAVFAVYMNQIIGKSEGKLEHIIF